jgi:hypothetical protein
MERIVERCAGLDVHRDHRGRHRQGGRRGRWSKPVFWVLEGHVECWLLNAKHLRHVPGRKTDVVDSAWICQLVEHALVRPSFVPPSRSVSCAI